MPVYSRPLLDTSGCDTPILGFNTIEKKILELMGSTAETFVNPIEDAMTGIQNGIGEVLGGLNTSLGVPFTDADGNPVLGPDGQPLTTFGYLANSLEDLNSGIDDFRIHTDRLSGVNLSNAFGEDSPYGPGGIAGEYPGLGGLHAIAWQYHTWKATLRDPEQAIKDHYSPIFNSLFGPGNDLMRSIDFLVKGDVANFLTNFPTGGNESLSELARIGSAIADLKTGITALINDDNLQLEFALDFIAKKTVGISVLQMLDQPCFGTKLLERIAGKDLRQITGL